MKKEHTDLNINVSKETFPTLIEKMKAELGDYIVSFIPPEPTKIGDYDSYKVKIKNASISIYMAFEPQDSLFRLSTICPDGMVHVSPKKKNKRIEQFYNALKPICQELGLKCNIITTETAEESLSPESYKAFSACIEFPYKAHDDDDIRWMKFIIAAHDAKEEITGDTIKDILISDYHMEGYAAERLSENYDFSRRLLAELEKSGRLNPKD